MRGRRDFAEAAAHTCSLPAGVMDGNVAITLHVGVKVRKMTHGKSGPLVCHRLDKGQGLGGRGANVVHPTLSETAKGCTLVGVHEPFVAPASDGMTAIVTFASTLAELVRIFRMNLTKAALLKERQLQGDLYERVRTHLLLFDELLPVSFKSEHIHVQVIRQPALKSRETAIVRECVCVFVST